MPGNAENADLQDEQREDEQYTTFGAPFSSVPTYIIRPPVFVKEDLVDKSAI